MNYDSSFKFSYKLFEDDVIDASQVSYQTQLLEVLNTIKIEIFFYYIL